MTRLAIGAAFSLFVATTSLAHADTEPDADVVAAATEANVSPTDLLGALNALEDAGIPTAPFAYLRATGELAPLPAPAPAVTHGYPAQVRLTYYVESGVTYSGGHPYRGSTACSWNFRIGQRFRLPDGEVVTCNDRGLLGSAGWLDLWQRPDLTRAYGPYATVEVIP